jgi:acylphosphatase
MIRKHLLLRGDVQGVGLRYRAYHAANRYGLTGWVRNLPDESVEMELQGREESIDLLLQALQSSPYINITSLTAKTVPTEEERAFTVLDDA